MTQNFMSLNRGLIRFLPLIYVTHHYLLTLWSFYIIAYFVVLETCQVFDKCYYFQYFYVIFLIKSFLRIRLHLYQVNFFAKSLFFQTRIAKVLVDVLLGAKEHYPVLMGILN